MRNRNTPINVRVTPAEKKKLQRNAKLCGLTLSGYLRNLGLGREVEPIPDKDYYRIYHMVDTLRNYVPELSGDKIDIYLEEICKELRKLYGYKSEGENNGDNENLGG